MSESTSECILFGAVLLALFSVLFILIGTKMAKSSGNRVAAAIFCLCLALLLVISLFRRPELLAILQKRAALYSLGLIIATVSIVNYIDRS